MVAMPSNLILPCTSPGKTGNTQNAHLRVGIFVFGSDIFVGLGIIVFWPGVFVVGTEPEAALPGQETPWNAPGTPGTNFVMPEAGAAVLGPPCLQVHLVPIGIQVASCPPQSYARPPREMSELSGSGPTCVTILLSSISEPRGEVAEWSKAAVC
jgi:hypothetical protein